MQGRHGDGVDKRDGAGLSRRSARTTLGEHARQYGVPLLFEPLNRYETNLVNTVARRRARCCESLATNNVKLLADLFHMNIEEVDIAAAIRAGAGAHRPRPFRRFQPPAGRLRPHRFRAHRRGAARHRLRRLRLRRGAAVSRIPTRRRA